MESSMMVTMEAITSTKTGMRTSGRTSERISETVTFDATSVSRVASPSPSPLMKVPVTASNGHRPSSCTNPTLLRHKPSRMMSG